MEIAVITCFDMKNLNYGNRLQAYALNYILNNLYSEYGKTTTLYFDDFKDFKRTKKEFILKRCIRKIKRDLWLHGEKVIPDILSKRLDRFNEFSTNNIYISDHPITRDEIASLPFDVYIVGSDVVWYQWDYGIRPIKLLDFKTNKNFLKISYAASFGNDYIPEENIDDLKRCFKTYTAISVRENSSVKLLNCLGVKKVTHVMDPTMLLNQDEWRKIEKPVYNLINQSYIFVYLLNNDKKDRLEIRRIANTIKLPIVTIPYASGLFNASDTFFGDIKVMDCAPEEWLWLIDNASYVFTDSFHGVALSAKLRTKFLVTLRKEKFEMNNRLYDFLKTINQGDKFIDLDQVENLEDFNWDFDKINMILKTKTIESKEYLEYSLKECQIKLSL